MDNFNYSSVDLNHLHTKTPFVRCNAVPSEIPHNHALTIVGSKKKVQWHRYDFTRMKIKYLTACVECAGNSRGLLPYATEGLQWDNRAVSNIAWGGVYLKDILHNVPEDAVEIVFTSLDKKFTRSLPVSMLQDLFLAYQMQHQDIPSIHGGPFRIIVPGWYGMAHVKWLDEIYFTNKPFEGEYQTDKYNYYDTNGNKTPVTFMKPKSLITWIVPQNPVMVRGKAWSGHSIKKVELCVDGEWQDTEIVERTGEYGWVLWEKQIVLPPGQHTLASRAHDVSGAYQPNEYDYNKYGYGNNAVQTIVVGV